MASDVTFEHVRLRRAQMAAPAARQRLSYLLSSAALRPSRMSPSGVLVVRSMRDPLPGAIAKDLASAAIPNPAWERAAQGRLDALCISAARPARSAVGAAAEAVLFADQSELLACLALDLSTGGGTAWWWKSILRSHLARGFGASPEVWLRVWAEHALYVPAAVELLDAKKMVVRVLERITPSQAWGLLLVVAGAFGIPLAALKADCDDAGPLPATGNRGSTSPGVSDESGLPAVRGESDTPAGQEHSTGSSGCHQTVTAPWEPYVASNAVPGTLGLERRALLGLSLLLQRAPRKIDAPRFVAQFRAWLSNERALIGANDADRATSPSYHLPPGPRAQDRSRARAPSTTDRPDTAQSPAGSGAASKATEGQADATLGVNESTADIHGDIQPALPVLNDASHTESRLLFEDGCQTRLGGVFYLVHLLLRSELLSFDVNLRGWALLELLARCLLYDEWEEVAEDPIWGALALLDLREPGTLPGADFTSLAAYEAPESWHRGLNESKRYVRFRSDRLEVWHEEGFLTLDTTTPIPTASTHSATYVRLTHQQYRAFRKGASVRAPGLHLSPQLRRFLHFLLPYVRWRLRRALGDTSLTDALRRTGMLYITPNHVDLVMRMKQISVPVRIAGLDANPGWTPELGRIIKFHFDDGGGP